MLSKTIWGIMSAFLSQKFLSELQVLDSDVWFQRVIRNVILYIIKRKLKGFGTLPILFYKEAMYLNSTVKVNKIFDA